MPKRTDGAVGEIHDGIWGVCALTVGAEDGASDVPDRAWGGVCAGGAAEVVGVARRGGSSHCDEGEQGESGCEKHSGLRRR